MLHYYLLEAAKKIIFKFLIQFEFAVELSLTLWKSEPNCYYTIVQILFLILQFFTQRYKCRSMIIRQHILLHFCKNLQTKLNSDPKVLAFICLIKFVRNFWMHLWNIPEICHLRKKMGDIPRAKVVYKQNQRLLRCWKFGVILFCIESFAK